MASKEQRWELNPNWRVLLELWGKSNLRVGNKPPSLGGIKHTSTSFLEVSRGVHDIKFYPISPIFFIQRGQRGKSEWKQSESPDQLQFGCD